MKINCPFHPILQPFRSLPQLPPLYQFLVFPSRTIPCVFLADILLNLFNIHSQPPASNPSCVAEARKLKIKSPSLHYNQSSWCDLRSSNQMHLYDTWFWNWAKWGERQGRAFILLCGSISFIWKGNLQNQLIILSIMLTQISFKIHLTCFKWTKLYQ